MWLAWGEGERGRRRLESGWEGGRRLWKDRGNDSVKKISDGRYYVILKTDGPPAG